MAQESLLEQELKDAVSKDLVSGRMCNNPLSRAKPLQDNEDYSAGQYVHQCVDELLRNKDIDLNKLQCGISNEQGTVKALLLVRPDDTIIFVCRKLVTKRSFLRNVNTYPCTHWLASGEFSSISSLKEACPQFREIISQLEKKANAPQVEVTAVKRCWNDSNIDGDGVLGSVPEDVMKLIADLMHKDGFSFWSTNNAPSSTKDSEHEVENSSTCILQ